jgi:hypothetical protein
MNLFHCPIFRWSRDGATHREGNPKSHRATIQSHKFKAVEWAPSRRPLDLRRAGSQIHRRGRRLTRSGLHSSSANRQVRLDSSANCQAGPVWQSAHREIAPHMPDIGRSTIPARPPQVPTRAGDPPSRVLRIAAQCRVKHPVWGGVRESAGREEDARGDGVARNSGFRPHPRAAPIRLGAYQSGVEFLDFPDKREIIWEAR